MWLDESGLLIFGRLICKKLQQASNNKNKSKSLSLPLMTGCVVQNEMHSNKQASVSVAYFTLFVPLVSCYAHANSVLLVIILHTMPTYKQQG